MKRVCERDDLGFLVGRRLFFLPLVLRFPECCVAPSGLLRCAMVAEKKPGGERCSVEWNGRGVKQRTRAHTAEAALDDVPDEIAEVGSGGFPGRTRTCRVAVLRPPVRGEKAAPMPLIDTVGRATTGNLARAGVPTWLLVFFFWDLVTC